MRCAFEAAGRHFRGREVVICSHENCKQKGLMPASGKAEDLYATCNGEPRSVEVGNWFGIFIEVFYITCREVVLVKRCLNLIPKCNCEQRAACLNTIGQRFANWLQTLWSKLTFQRYNQS